MKGQILIVLLAFSIVTGWGQEKKEVKYHLISLESEKDTPLEYRYYVENVYDGRQFKENIGTVQKGAFNAKMLARFEKPFEQEIKNYLVRVLPKNENTKPISLRINDLFVSERTEASSEMGFAAVVADVIITVNGQDYIVGTVAANIEGSGMDVTGKHDDRIKLALQKCIGRFEVIPEEEFTKIPFNANEPVLKKEIGKAPKGIYISYTDMLKNKPVDDTNYYLKADGDKYYLINTVTSKKAEYYYAYSDGEIVYLNVSKYANDKYYAKTEIIAGKYFIEDVVYNVNNTAMMTAMFGVMGALMSVGEEHVPMLIDGDSGQPFFLSNSEVKTLLSPYPDLLKQYKKSKRTTGDVKTALIKYYALQEASK